MSENENCSRTYASIIITGDSFNPIDISSTLEIDPSSSFRKGDRRGEKGVWNHSFWELSSKEEVTSTNLNLHLAWLIAKLLPNKEKLSSLCLANRSIKAYISCFWESKTGHGGPDFSPDLMCKIGELNLELSIDIYFAD